MDSKCRTEMKSQIQKNRPCLHWGERPSLDSRKPLERWIIQDSIPGRLTCFFHLLLCIQNQCFWKVYFYHECMIFEWVCDIDFFSNQIQQLIYLKITVVQILKGLILVNFDIHIQYLSPKFLNILSCLIMVYFHKEVTYKTIV